MKHSIQGIFIARGKIYLYLYWYRDNEVWGQSLECPVSIPWGKHQALINVMLDCLMNWSQQAHCETLFELKSFELKSMPRDEFYVTTKYLCPKPL